MRLKIIDAFLKTYDSRKLAKYSNTNPKNRYGIRTPQINLTIYMLDIIL